MILELCRTIPIGLLLQQCCVYNRNLLRVIPLSLSPFLTQLNSTVNLYRYILPNPFLLASLFSHDNTTVLDKYRSLPSPCLHLHSSIRLKKKKSIINVHQAQTGSQGSLDSILYISLPLSSLFAGVKSLTLPPLFSISASSLFTNQKLSELNSHQLPPPHVPISAHAVCLSSCYQNRAVVHAHC